MLKEVIGALQRHEGTEIESDVREKLLNKYGYNRQAVKGGEGDMGPRGRSGTKPGTLLEHQISIKIFFKGDEQSTGFVEMDLAGHGEGIVPGITYKN